MGFFSKWFVPNNKISIDILNAFTVDGINTAADVYMKLVDKPSVTSYGFARVYNTIRRLSDLEFIEVRSISNRGAMHYVLTQKGNELLANVK